jgi:hypothetical protein
LSHPFIDELFNGLKVLLEAIKGEKCGSNLYLDSEARDGVEIDIPLHIDKKAFLGHIVHVIIYQGRKNGRGKKTGFSK